MLDLPLGGESTVAPLLQIGQFSRLAGISAKQLRAYDQIALFRPAWVDPSSAYRYYSPAQLPELRRILALRQLGMPLEEIGRLAAGGNMREALDRRRAELENERRRAEERLAALEISVEADVVVRPVPVEPVAVAAITAPVDEAFDRLEAHVRDLRRRAHRPPGAIPSEGIIFVPVTGAVPATEEIEYRRLPAARMATVIHRGSYAGIARVRSSLDAWLQASGLSATGPMRTLYLQFGADPSLRLPAGWTVDRAEQFVTELQAPIG